MATHSSVLAWRIPGTGEPGGLLSLGSHRVGHDGSDLAAAGYSMAPVGGQRLKLGPCPNFFKGTPGFTSVRLYTNDLIICNHQGTGAALKFSAFAEKYQEHLSDSAFEAMIGPGKQESAAPSYKIRKTSGVWKENQMQRRWCLPVGTTHCWEQSTKAQND
ncbi:hypothetical protein AB1E18_007237 [Capra hircus]